MTAAETVHEMDEMGAHGDDGEVWLPRSRYTREQARTWMTEYTGERWIDHRVLARHMRHCPEHPAAGEFDGEYWTECEKDAPGAFPVWRCE